MPTPAWDDLDVFIDADDFAVWVIITPASGQARRIKAIFDEPYLNAILGEYENDNSKPRLQCKAADVAGLKRGDAVSVPEEGNFVIMTNPQTDGTGMAVLEMTRDD